jgi:hypothetical protein
MGILDLPPDTKELAAMRFANMRSNLVGCNLGGGGGWYMVAGACGQQQWWCSAVPVDVAVVAFDIHPTPWESLCESCAMCAS